MTKMNKLKTVMTLIGNAPVIKSYGLKHNPRNNSKTKSKKK